MLQGQDWGERRQFGRREMRVQGVAYVPGRPPAYCIVRDLSEGGAFLEFLEPLVPALNFRLVIEGKYIDVMCEVRHLRRRGVGVLFDTIATAAETVAAPEKRTDTELRRAVLEAIV